MNWLIPSALGIAGVAVAVAVALHFIARSRPVAETLPTARFVPERPVYARTRSVGLTDILLLLLRIAAVAAIGIAVAGPMIGRHGRVTRIVVLDRSRSVASISEARDSVKSIASATDIVIPFDSAARRPIALNALDSVGPVAARGSLSAALAAAARAAVPASATSDSIELVVVSPLAREEMDEATSRLRAVWPGRIQLVPVRAVLDAPTKTRIEARGAANDAVVAGLSLTGLLSPSGSVRLVRGLLWADDSAWAAVAGHVLVHWPATDADASWTHRTAIDAVGGVTSSAATVVARLPRLWVLTGSSVARWSDGEPAAVEHAVGAGCIRDVGVLIDQASDLTLREPFRRFASALMVPCGGPRSNELIDAATRTTLAGAGPLAAGPSLRDTSTEASRWTPWLLMVGALLLIVELAARRTTRSAA